MGTQPKAGTVGGIAGEQLRAIVERVERLNDEKAALNADISDIFKEARGNGFDVPTIKQLIKLRKADPNELSEAEYLLQTYQRAIGMLPSDDAGEREAA